MRRVLFAVLGFGAAGVLAVVAINLWVLAAGRSGDHARAQVALVLGAQVHDDGRLSSMLEDRVVTAVDLYRSGRVGKLLLSGDHGRVGYDEVGAMRRRAVALGVPERDVFTDHAGFNTWDSVVRAKKVFAVEDAIVVTQGFHLPRAVFLARRAGLDVSGVSADRRPYGPAGRANGRREYLARVKSFGEVVAGRDPRFLGPRIPIEGDGRVSWGP